MKLKIVFYDIGRRVCCTSKQSIIRSFREYMNIVQPPGFSDCRAGLTGDDYTPHPSRYIPLVYSGMKDKNNRELWEGHIVDFKMIEDNPTLLTGEVGFEEDHGWFGIQFKEGNDTVFMPLFGIDPMKIEIIRHKYNGFDEEYLSTVKYG